MNVNDKQSPFITSYWRGFRGAVNAAASTVVDSIHTCSVRNRSSGIALSHTHSAIFNSDQ